MSNIRVYLMNLSHDKILKIMKGVALENAKWVSVSGEDKNTDFHGNCMQHFLRPLRTADVHSSLRTNTSMATLGDHSFYRYYKACSAGIMKGPTVALGVDTGSLAYSSDSLILLLNHALFFVLGRNLPSSLSCVKGAVAPIKNRDGFRPSKTRSAFKIILGRENFLSAPLVYDHTVVVETFAYRIFPTAVTLETWFSQPGFARCILVSNGALAGSMSRTKHPRREQLHHIAFLASKIDPT